MKMIHGLISTSAKLMAFTALLACLPQTSHQETGKKRCQAAITEALIHFMRVLNKYLCSG